MKNFIIFSLITVLLLGSIFGITQVEAKNTKQQVFGTVLQPIDTCPQINVGMIDSPIYRNDGWCPGSHAFWYFIEEPDITSNALIDVDVNFPLNYSQNIDLYTAPVCHHGFAGTFNFASGPLTGFTVECDPNLYPPVANQTLSFSYIGYP